MFLTFPRSKRRLYLLGSGVSDLDKMQDARRAELHLNYNGVGLSLDITNDAFDFTYTDAAPGSLDDISLSLQDRDRLWQSPEWAPLQGDKIKAEIRTINWTKPGEVTKLPLGSFEVDSFTFTGPPDAVSIKAVSLPVAANIRQEKRTKAWEKVTLKTIAADVAKKAGLKLSYLLKDTYSYERLDQTDQSDIEFLNEQAKSEGVAIKVTGGQLVLFDEFEFEKAAPVLTLTRGKDNILSYEFGWSAADASYIACEISYTQAKSKKTIKAVYKPPGAPKIGPVLKINEQARSQAEALRIAKKALREKNKELSGARFTIIGDTRIAAGVTVMIEGFGSFDNKYLITSATHQLGSGGYTTDIEMRQTLGW
jgi:hypothetical protein